MAVIKTNTQRGVTLEFLIYMYAKAVTNIVPNWRHTHTDGINMSQPSEVVYW